MRQVCRIQVLESGSSDRRVAAPRKAGSRYMSMKHPDRPPARTWWTCFLLFLATSIVYLDRQVLALTAGKIIADFGLTNEGFGQIVAAFRYSYGLVQIFGGFLVDAYGPRI